ncbi:MAG: c-type cytochrome biogenesis protein CcsB [Proteobacteria bacterium]|nr:c-type cytochrome biogenesis protein CcsB [Pseudomonadota bacterium]
MTLIAVLILYFLSTLCYVLYFAIQKEHFQKTGFILILIGFVIHGGQTLMAFVQTGEMPAQNLHQTLSIAALSLSGVFLILRSRLNLKILGTFAAPLVTIIMIAAVKFPDVAVASGNIFKSIWLTGHIITIFIGEAAFSLAFGAGVLYLIQEHAIKTKKHGYFFKRLPSLELIDQTGYLCIIVGFTAITIGLATGMVYAKMIWGRFWSWDPKEVWSGISWLLYAVLLHERLTVGWRGRRSAIMAIIGFIVLLFTFFGVNMLLEGHHGKFTTW